MVCRSAMGAGHVGFRARLGTWVVLACTTELIALGVMLCGKPTLLLYNFYWVVEFGCLYSIAQSMRPMPPLIGVSTGSIFMFLWGANMLVIDPLVEIVHLSIVIGALTLVGIYLFQLWFIADKRNEPIWHLPETWVCLAVLVFYGATAPLLGASNYFVEHDMALALVLDRISTVFFFAKLVLMGVACLKARASQLAHV